MEKNKVLEGVRTVYGRASIEKCKKKNVRSAIIGEKGSKGLLS